MSGSSPASIQAVPASIEVLGQLPADTLLGFVFADAPALGGALGLVDWHLCGLLAETLARGRFRGLPSERLLLPTFGRLAAKQVVALGLGPALDCVGGLVHSALTTAQQVLQRLCCRQVGVLLPAAAAFEPPSRHAQAKACAVQIKRALSLPQPGFVPAGFLAPPIGHG